MRFLGTVGAISIVLVACQAPGDGDTEAHRSTRQSIVGGMASNAAQDATVLISDAGYPICTGTLIAPNLVLTARHCVTDFNDRSECGQPLGANSPATRLTISSGVNASPASYVARGVQLFLPDSDQICSSDVALISLDNDVKSVTPAKVRFGAPTKDEIGTAVGYGDNTSAREQRVDVKVLAVGPSRATYETQQGETLAIDPLVDEIVTTESTCYGDSGGPLFDSRGQIFAVASRGLDDRCRDRPTYWTTLGGFEKLIKDAATTAGHPLVAATPPTSPTGANPAVAGDGTETSDPSGDKSKKQKKSSGGSDIGIDSSGCALTAGSRAPSSTVATCAGATLLLLALRRRRSCSLRRLRSSASRR